MQVIAGRSRLEVQIGLCTRRGSRPDNQDYAGCYLGDAAERARLGVVVALADGVGGHKGGRVAAETAVRGFVDGMLGQSELLGLRRTMANAVETINAWIHAVSATDRELDGMACTLTAAVLRDRQIHIAHVGDSRLYRLRDGELDRLTSDHVWDKPGMRDVLRRAIGPSEAVQIDYRAEALRIHDRFLVCSDGVHGALAAGAIRDGLAGRASSQETAEALVTAALQAGGTDNATALVIDVLDLPVSRQADLAFDLAAQPILPVPDSGAVIDGFRLGRVLSDGRYGRVFLAQDETADRAVVIKVPKEIQGTDDLLRHAFLREAWIATRVRSPWIAGAISLPPGRQTRLYSVQPYWAGETLEERLKRPPPIAVADGLRVGIQLARAAAALHRAGIIHRDIKPDNVILGQDPDGSISIRLVDLGVARIPNVEDFSAEHAPGTPSFMAPELFDGAAGDEASDQFAIGVTLYRLFSGTYPYGEIEPFSHPRFGAVQPISSVRPDLPAWLDAAILRAVSVAPADRFGDALELAFALEHGALLAAPVRIGRRSLYDRNPLLFWKALAALFGLLLLVTLGYLAVLSGEPPKPPRGIRSSAMSSETTPSDAIERVGNRAGASSSGMA